MTRSNVPLSKPIGPDATSDEILARIGHRLRAYRLQQNRPLADVATAAGLGLRTAQRAEAGRNPTLDTLVRMLRALGRLDAIEAFLPPPLISPVQLARLSGRARRRAGTRRRRPGGAR